MSSKGLDAIFGIDNSFERSVEGWASLVHPAERDSMVAYLTDEVMGRGQPFDRQYRIVRADTGQERLVHGLGAVHVDESGRPVRMIGTVADITEQVAAEEERARLELGLRRSEHNLAEAQRIAHIGSWAWDLATNSAERSAELHRIYGVEPDSIPGTTEAFLVFVHPDDRARVQSSELAAISSSGRYALDYRIVRPDGTVRDIHDEAEAVYGPSGAPVGMIGTVQDVTERVADEHERTRLTKAVEQSSDAIVTTDISGTIDYINPSFELVSGYRRDELIGQNPRILQSGRQSAAFYRTLWRRLARGDNWSGRFSNRSKAGQLYEVEATISPIRGSAGNVTGYIGVERDVTALLAAKSRLATEFRERAEVAVALGRIQPGPNAEATAAAVCDQLLGLAGIDSAAIYSFLGPTHAVPLAVVGPDGLPAAPGQPVPTARAAYLYEHAAHGPWAEAWRSRPEDGAYGEAMARLGVLATAYAPIRIGERLLGLLLVATTDDAYARHLVDHLPAVGEFAATASALLSGQLERGHLETLTRERVRRVLRERSFSPVFQPIVDLATGEPVGYEALTRFADGTRPDQMIADAHAVGLGLELEVACLAAALDASTSLPGDCWLSVNAAPDVILQVDQLAALVRDRSRRIVLEITEHVVIEDYPAVLRAVARLGPTVSLSVDDAGAGFASLHHVVELAPRFLKLDISLVRGVDRDATRQAMIAGLTQFAGRVGCQVIAEGVEEQAELLMLRELGVPLGQGYLFGRPEAVPRTPDEL